jgi:hypothetical protein
MKEKVYLINREIFYVLSFGSLILTCLELVKPRLVLAWLNINLWLAVWLASGIIMLAIKPGRATAKK